MTSVGIMASAVAIAPACTDVLREPFDNFARWTLTSSPTIVAGRNGTAANVTGTLQRLTYTIPAVAESDTVTVGFAFQTPVFQSTAHVIFYLYSDTNTTQHTTIQTQSTGRIDVGRGGATQWSSAAGVLAINVWQYVEVQIKLHDTTGFVIVRVNGVEVINVSGVDTKNAGTKTTYDTLRLGVVNGSSGGTNLFDDLYISTGAGCTFKGDQVIVNTGPDLLFEPFYNFTAWTVLSTPAIVAGRNGTAGEINSISDQFNFNIPAALQSDTVTMGFAWRSPVLQTVHEIVNFRSDTGVTSHDSLTVSSAGALSVARAGTNLAITAAGTLTVNTWYYIEVQIKLHDTTGSAIVRLNGVEVINATGLDTKAVGTKTVYDQIRFSTPSGGSGGTNQIDDLYISSGAVAFKGDITIP